MSVHAAGHDPHAGGGHAHPTPKVYFITFGWLMLLLIITVAAYHINLENYTHFKGTNLIFALLIAITKAALVVLYFMNVKGSTKLTWLWASLGFLWLLLMGGIFLDYMTRAWVEPGGWQQTPYMQSH